MKVTVQQKVLGGVLVLGAIALTMDRLFFLRPDQSDNVTEPASSYAISAAPAPKETAPVAASVSEPASISLAKRLRQIGSLLAGSQPRDAFALGAAWPAMESATRHVEATARQFQQTHKLTGALTSGANVHAMIDGKIVSVGDSIDGYRLVAISHRSAEFQSATGESVLLNMAEHSGASDATMSASIAP